MIITRIMRGTGEFLITAGLVILLFIAYELWVTDIFAAHSQQALHHTIEDQWRTDSIPHHTGPGGVEIADVPFGHGIAILRIPRFGKSYNPVIVEGVGTYDLEKGPGHYPGTASPGEIGNFVVSGHRTTYGKPFNRLGEMQVGDHIVVETRTMWFTYTVTQKLVVLPTDTDVILPVPGKPGATPTQRLLTFTTCNPKFSAAQRLIIHGRLTEAKPRSQGLPTALLSGV